LNKKKKGTIATCPEMVNFRKVEIIQEKVKIPRKEVQYKKC